MTVYLTRVNPALLSLSMDLLLKSSKGDKLSVTEKMLVELYEFRVC